MTIIEAMQALNYHPNEGGVCFGIAQMAAQAHARGEFGKFIERFRLIKSMNKADLVNQINQLEELRRNDSSHAFNKEEELILSIKPFFENLTLYMNCLGNDPDIIKNIGLIQMEQNIEKANRILNEEYDKSTEQYKPISDRTKNKLDNGIYVQSQSVDVFDEDSLKDLIFPRKNGHLTYETISYSTGDLYPSVECKRCLL
ncbi:hypothetical protein L3V86_07630 [Thiotrichales bacterium 19S11-10]|nr:hypothetical protein [Thiotrichales bacterium 19S11-10]